MQGSFWGRANSAGRGLPGCGFPDLRVSPAAGSSELRPPELRASLPVAPAVEHFAEVQALEGGGALSRFRLACWMRSAECAAARGPISVRLRGRTCWMRSFPISAFRDKKGRYVSRRGNPQVSPEWLERESPGRKSTGTRVGYRAARRRSHIARFCPRRLGFREEGPHDGVRRR